MSSDNREQERGLDDERYVDALLAEGGFPDDAELRDVLLRLRSLRVDEVPPPSAELAALMGPPRAADVVHLDEWSRTRPRKKRVVFTTLAVAASPAGRQPGTTPCAARQKEPSAASSTPSPLIQAWPLPRPRRRRHPPIHPPSFPLGYRRL